MNDIDKIVAEEIVFLRYIANCVENGELILPSILKRIKYLAEMKKH